MKKTVDDILLMIKENDIKMVDFKMVDINGQFRHVTIPAKNFSERTMKNGIGFDASNYGYAVVEKSDMVFIPDPDTAVIDPFCEIPTLSMTGNATSGPCTVPTMSLISSNSEAKSSWLQEVTVIANDNKPSLNKFLFIVYFFSFLDS